MTVDVATHAALLRGPDCLRIVSNALLFASPPQDSRPALTGVRLISDGRRVWAIGCDPFRLAWDSAEPLQADAFSVTLPRELAETIVRELKPLKKNVLATATITERDVRIAPVNVTADYTPVSEGYPDWEKVVPANGGEAIQRYAFTTSLFGDLAKVISDTPYTRVQFHGELGPANVEIGTTFRALIMPVRTGGEFGSVATPPSAKVEAVA